MAAKTGIKSTLSALALGTALLALPGAALAQDDHRDHGNGAPHQQEAPRPAPAAPAPRAAPPAPAAQRGGDMRGGGQWNGQARPAPGGPAATGPGNAWQGRGGQPNYAPGQGRPPQGQPAFQGQPRGDGGPGRNDGGQWRGDAGPGRNDGGPGRDDGRRGGPGYGQPGYGQPGYGRGQPGGQWSHNWRQDNRYDWRGWRDQNRDTFHVGRYYPPYRDYAYNRLGIGFYVQPMFFGSDYWIADPWYYHLPPAYGPYHWVRYYNDVILVNTYTGQVADVIYDFFW